MACPTCDNTLELVFQDRMRTLYHCPRCGTMRSDLTGHVHDTVPKLVERCRQLVQCLIEGEQPEGLEAMHILGIAESIHPSSERPPS